MLHLFCQIKFIDAVLKIILSLLFEFKINNSIQFQALIVIFTIIIKVIDLNCCFK